MDTVDSQITRLAECDECGAELDAAGRCFRCEHAASLDWLHARLRDALKQIEKDERQRRFLERIDRGELS